MKKLNLLPAGYSLSNNLMQTRYLVLMILVLGFTACNKVSDDNKPQAVESNKYSASISSGDFWICGTNNASNKLEIYDQITYPDINNPSALKWSWMPSTSLGYTSTEVSLWTNGDPEGDPMDAKLRNSTYWSGSTQVVVSVGGQLATVCRYQGGTKGQKLWARNVGAGSYPHAAEILPNGNVAVAASHGDWVRVYNTTSGATNYTSYSLAGAHGVLWDPAYNCLWAIGDTKIIKFSVGGTKTSPTLTVVSTTTIPGNGHDLSAFLGNNNKLWFTSSGAVYIYDKPSGTYVTAPGASNRAAIKAVSNQPSGQIVETKPHQDCSLSTWCTPHVQFYNGTTGTLEATYTKTGAAFYKVDVWTDLYQTPSQTATLTPIEDAYMRDGIYGDINYGTETGHTIKHGATNYSRKAFFKFDVSSIPSTVTKVKLRVYGSNIESTSNVTIKSYYSSTDNWTETGITWNNAPLAYSIGSTTVNNTLKYYEWDVTSYVRDQVNGDNIASLVLHQIAGGNLTTTWHSREGVNKPQLVITY